MSKYTTGELAKLCGVTVRTIQFYDSKGILTPSELSEGGRRLYTDGDRRKLDIICFLKSLGLNINTISEILRESNSADVLLLLLQQQKKMLEEERNEKKLQVEKINELEKALMHSETDVVSMEDISDMAQTMEQKKDMRKLRATMLTIGVIMDIIEIATIVLWIRTGIWWPFALGMPVVIALGIILFRHYYFSVKYVCPECRAVFRPSIKDFFFSRHTPRTRKLSCIKCGTKSYCIEVFEK